MGAPAIASLVLVPFPFGDLSASKLRPAVALAGVGKGDWILCMVTGNAWADPHGIRSDPGDLVSGSLSRVRYARPGKLFTANRALIVREIGVLRKDRFDQVRDATVKLIRP